MKQSGPNIQKHILQIAAKKRAVPLAELCSYVEEQLPAADRKVNLKYIVTRSVKNMEKSGELNLHETDTGLFAKITPTGRQKLRSLRLSENTHLMPIGWDGKWRIVILDVPEKDKEKRNALRYILKKAKFVCLKNSVWISPYPFEHMFQNMKDDLGLSEELMIIVSDSLDPESERTFQESYWK